MAAAARNMKPYLYGLVASLGLLSLYGITMTLLSGWPATIEQFRALWYLMLPLTAGFGVQVGLYAKLKATMKQKANAALASGGTSASVSMLACCAHHATDVLPFLGLSGASIFLTRYQTSFLTISLGVNAIGVGIMVKHLKNL